MKWRIEIIDNEKEFCTKLFDGKSLVATARYEGKFFLYKGKSYLLTGGDYFLFIAKAATLYELKEIADRSPRP